MLKKINAVNVCGTIAFISMIATAGFLGGDNYIAAIISLIMLFVFSYLALNEDAQTKK